MSRAPDPHPWRGAVVVGTSLTVLAMAFSLTAERFVEENGWVTPQDVWFLMQAAHYIANGALGYVYEATQYIYALPLFPILLAPLAALGEALELSEWIPYQLQYPTMWLVLGPYGLSLAGIAVTYASRAFAHASNARGSTLATQICVALLVVFPAAALGHFEDVLALTFVLLALRSVLNKRFEVAALLLGVAIGFKQWAGLGLLPFIALIPRGARLRCLMLALALPGSLAAFTLLVDWQHAAPALLSSPTFPDIGHAAPWLDPEASLAATVPYRLVALAFAGAVAWRFRNGADTDVMVAGFALVFLARGLLEPVPLIYYMGPALGLLLLQERLTHGRQTRTLVLGFLLLGWFVFSLPNPLWWPIFVAGCIVLAIPSVRLVFRRSVCPRGEARNADRPKNKTGPIRARLFPSAE